MKRVAILGSTGSIGRNALRVLEALPDRFRLVGLAANTQDRLALEQAARFGARHVALADPAAARRAAAAAPPGLTVHAGAEGVEAIASLGEPDIVICALVGLAGLRPALAAICRGATLALATKEVLVAAGAPVMAACARHGARLLPVDSEHSAIFQCLRGAGAETPASHRVRRLVLTASGGPFAARPEVNLDTVTVEQALNHPRWKMGQKVTIDSATLMNKGLEIIEAHWMFSVPVSRIDVLVHPESLVHSMVEFNDGSVVAQLSPPDMRFAIQYAMTYPERLDGGLPALDLAADGPLRFSRPDEDRFPCLRLARRAAEAGGALPAVLNAANEIAVKRFLDRNIAFSGIWELVEAVMDRHRGAPDTDLETILAADAWARTAAEEWQPAARPNPARAEKPKHAPETKEDSSCGHP